MPDPVYFQWQNEALLKTIYPMREIKLRDFLVFYKEIDLWAEYKNKPAAELQLENKEFQAAQVRLIEAALAEYNARRAYFLKPEVQADYAQAAALDPDEMKKINLVHGQFIQYFPKLGGEVRKEKYFVAQQVSTWEVHRNEVLKRLAQARNRETIVHETQKAAARAETGKLEKGTLVMAEEELKRLRAFLASFGKIEKFKTERLQARTADQTRQKSLLASLEQAKLRLGPLAGQQKTLQAEVNRLRNRPNGPALEQYLTNPEVSTSLRNRFPQADVALAGIINPVHREIAQGFRLAKEVYGKIAAVQAALKKIGQARTDFNAEITKIETDLRNMPATWVSRPQKQARLSLLRAAYLPALEAELDQLNDCLAALNYSIKAPAELALLLQEKEKQLATVNASAMQLNAETASLQQQISALEAALQIPDEQILTKITPAQTLTAKDLVLWKLEQYKTALTAKSHQQLIEEIVQRFTSAPQRYPPWLQYMVIHFSGMRYQSAHGSWADPRQLLVNLRTATIDKDYKGLDDATILTLCQDKLASYQPPAPTLLSESPARQSPLLAQTKDSKWLAKIAGHLRGLQSPNAFHQRRALIELRTDEENFEVQALSGEEVKAALVAARNQYQLPDWMWAEIVKLTDLRVQEVTGDDWENLTAQQLEERNSAKWTQYRQLMNQWKQENLTGWREEHNRTNQLIVTRAVCNETAEHIQHLRGNSPPGGLAAKPGWYMKNEKNLPGKAYFRKALKPADFTVGASVFWLQYVTKYPNPWQLATDIKLNNGEGLLPPGLFTARAAGPANSKTWFYEKGDGFKRTRSYLDEKKVQVNELQWLRWLHEATVAAVAETAEGTVIYTFETARPGDDKAVSCIGMFKHTLSSLTYTVSGETFFPIFVGYTPEGVLPEDDLKFMLDWNRILRRPIT